jgi:hypothetical protein
MLRASANTLKDELKRNKNAKIIRKQNYKRVHAFSIANRCNFVFNAHLPGKMTWKFRSTVIPRVLGQTSWKIG